VSFRRTDGLLGIAAGALLGLAAGLGGYTFLYAKGGSYLTNDRPPARTAMSCRSTKRTRSSNTTSNGFHAPQEAARLLAESIDASRKGQNALKR